MRLDRLVATDEPTVRRLEQDDPIVASAMMQSAIILLKKAIEQNRNSYLEFRFRITSALPTSRLAPEALARCARSNSTMAGTAGLYHFTAISYSYG